MRNLSILLMVMICINCAQLPADIPNPTQQQTQAVVFDIDGTLTPRPIEMWTARTDAAKAVHLFADWCSFMPRAG